MDNDTQTVESSEESGEDSSSEPPDGSSTEPPDDSSSEPPVAAYNAGVVGWLYHAISLTGIVMAVGGVLGELYMTGEMRSGLVPPGQLVETLSAGEPAALTTLGIWVLLVGPGLALVSMFVTGIQRKSWPAVVLAALVLAIIIAAVPIMNCIEGGV